METIHFKTVDPVSQELLRGASRRGVELNWERYEKQQPQDGSCVSGLPAPTGVCRVPAGSIPTDGGRTGGSAGSIATLWRPRFSSA